MDTTKPQQKTLDDDLVAPENRLKIEKRNQRLSPTLKFNEPTIQVALDALKLTPFYNAFDISADVPEIYMQEFWATITKHHFSLCFKMNGKRDTVNVDNFRDMLKICPKLPGQKFKDPPFEEEILSFIRDFSEAYKTYLAYATGEKTPKPKSTKKKADFESSPKTKPTQASKGKRIKTSAKGVKPAKKKQSTTKSKGLTMLSEVALTEAEQMKIALERSKTQQHNSYASGSDDDEAGMHDDNDDNDDDDNNDDNDDDTKNQDDDDQEHDDQDDDEQDDVNELTDLDNDDPRVHTPSNYESTDDEESDEEIQGANVEGEEMDEEETNEEDEANELYRDVNVNMEGRDIEITDAPRTIIQTTQVIEDTHVIITLVNPEAQQ
ncbi:hypothetical protein Tco_1108314 [Tanacetum coccineum]